MGAELCANSRAARAVFAEVDDALDMQLTRLMMEGPADQLSLTSNAQPALMAVGVATVRALEAESGRDLADLVDYVAGHSLGEYSALVVSGALGLRDCARLLRLRGQAMQDAVPVGAGQMAAIIGLDMEAVEALVTDRTDEASPGFSNDLAIANDNAPGQIVLAGTCQAIEAAILAAKKAGARRAVQLNVSAPFHCPLMQPAAERMEKALVNTRIATPAIPVIANVTARPVSDPDTICELLIRQVCARVRWYDSMQFFCEAGGREALEAAPGSVLCGLMRRIQPDLPRTALATYGDLVAWCNEADA